MSERWTLDFSLPGQPGDATKQKMIDTYGTSSFDTYIAVVTVPEGETVQDNAEEIAGVFESTADATAQSTVRTRLVDYASTGDEAFISDNGRTTFAMIQGPLRSRSGQGSRPSLNLP